MSPSIVLGLCKTPLNQSIADFEVAYIKQSSAIVTLMSRRTSGVQLYAFATRCLGCVVPWHQWLFNLPRSIYICLAANRIYHRIEIVISNRLRSLPQEILASRKAVFLPIYLLACVRWMGFLSVSRYLQRAFAALSNLLSGIRRATIYYLSDLLKNSRAT